MFFNSLTFFIFLPLVFCLYWFIFNRKLKWQNIFLITAGYIFYGWWDWRFLFLLAFSSVADFIIGRTMGRLEDQKKRKALLWVSLAINLTFLGFFKYFNFFVDSFITSFSFIGLDLNPRTLNVILPVGISFYTFQSLSYTIDIYFKRIQPVRDPLAFFAFVSFFPQLVAGPIERAKNMIPQFENQRNFSYSQAADGLKLMVWGFFKKVAVADVCGVWANIIFDNYSRLNGSTLLLGAVLFAFQIYGDFSGYSDIARGTAKLLGFELMKNFNLPYFSRSIKEFWTRWHISLSTWFKDYVYIPLGGSHCSKPRRILNTLVTFTVSGFWHGANWTYVNWGFLNGLYLVPSALSGKKVDQEIVAKGRLLPNWKEFLQVSRTFLLIVFAWIFFRSSSMTDAFLYVKNMFHFGAPNFYYWRPEVLLMICVLITIEWLQREKDHPLILNKGVAWRWGFYALIILLILYFGNFTNPIKFIYFQF